ncbi:cancer/testis antigen 1-like isoform X2 [Dipodomys merriami]|uniref:cancer/testis antigen 1-like isoform X2 n=1 Tax=Dipodomys merriami TaxID=94247 RepID=UPI0038560804
MSPVGSVSSGAVGVGHEDGDAGIQDGCAGPAVPSGLEGEGAESAAAEEAQQDELDGGDQVSTAAAAAAEDVGQQMLMYYLTVPFLSSADAESACRTLIHNAHLLRGAVNVEFGVVGRDLLIEIVAENYDGLYISIAAVIYQLSILMEAMQFLASLSLHKRAHERGG